MCAPQPTHPRGTAEGHPDKMGSWHAWGEHTAPPDTPHTAHGTARARRGPDAGPGGHTDTRISENG